MITNSTTEKTVKQANKARNVPVRDSAEYGEVQRSNVKQWIRSDKRKEWATV